MRTSFFPLLMILTILACSPKKESNSSTVRENQTPTTENVASAGASNGNFSGFEAFVGKKPADVQLFDKANLNSRIEKLLGSEYQDFKADWNTESNIKKDGEILYFTGCKSSDCNENKYFFMLDLIDSNFNIINIRNGRPRSFEEGPVIGMPDGAAQDFDKVRQGQPL